MMKVETNISKQCQLALYLQVHEPINIDNSRQQLFNLSSHLNKKVIQDFCKCPYAFLYTRPVLEEQSYYPNLCSSDVISNDRSVWCHYHHITICETHTICVHLWHSGLQGFSPVMLSFFTLQVFLHSGVLWSLKLNYMWCITKPKVAMEWIWWFNSLQQDCSPKLLIHKNLDFTDCNHNERESCFCCSKFLKFKGY